MAGLTKNKANSAQLGLAGAWAELGNIRMSEDMKTTWQTLKNPQAVQAPLADIFSEITLL